MEKLKNVGAGPVSAQKEVIDDCPEFSKRNKPKTHEMHNLHTNFNGITLIALIITIIVMLILVGVTISVALNGGLFETANKAATGTQKEAERERLTEIVLANYNVAEGKITDTNDLANKIQSSLGLKKSDKTTDSKLVIEGKNTLWQVDLVTAEVKEYEQKAEDNVKYVYTGNNCYYVILKNNDFYIATEGIKILQGKYMENVEITTLSICTGYNIDDELKGFNKFIVDDSENILRCAISDDNCYLYGVETINNNINKLGEFGHLTNGVDLSEYNF